MCIVRNRLASIAAPHEVERFQHSSGMIPVSVGQHNALDDAQIDTGPPGIALERIFLRPAVEKNRVAARSAGSRYKEGKAVTGAAKRVT